MTAGFFLSMSKVVTVQRLQFESSLLKVRKVFSAVTKQANIQERLLLL